MADMCETSELAHIFGCISNLFFPELIITPPKNDRPFDKVSTLVHGNYVLNKILIRFELCSKLPRMPITSENNMLLCGATASN